MILMKVNHTGLIPDVQCDTFYPYHELFVYFSFIQELKKLFVIGILNDAVSAVLGCAWQDPTCRMGAVIGVPYDFLFKFG